MPKKRKQKKNDTKKHYRQASRARRTRILLQRVTLGATVTLALMVVGLVTWSWHMGYIQQAGKQVSGWGIRKSAEAGLVLEDVYLEGQHYASSDDIVKALQVSIGEPLLAIDLKQIRKRLERLNWVEYAVVTRQLPHTLHVQIMEYEPLAIWQSAGKLYLVDVKGHTIVTDDITPFAKLPVMVGYDAPLYAENLLRMIHSEPRLAKHVNAAIRVGERRWNIRFDNGLEVKLPENNQESAWKFLSELEHKHKILEDNRKTVDLRIPGKVYIRNNDI